MLDSFRENARSVVIQVTIAAIALVFIFSFGPGSRGCTGGGGINTWAATVNGETIPASTFDQAYRQRVYFQRLRRGGTYTVDDARADNLRAETLKEVVDRELAAQAALRHGLWVSDAELAEEIRGATQFHRDGRFDAETYRKYVINVEGLQPRKFEERLRRDMLAQRMFQLAMGATAVSEDELRAEFVRTRESAAIEYVRFLPAHFVDQAEASDAEVEAVLADRLDEVRARFEKSRFLYVQPRGVQVRRLFAAVRPDATQEAEAAARASIEKARTELEGGASFEQVAADPALDAETEPVWVELGRSPFGRSFEEAAFKLEKGQRSDVVRDRLGFHLIEAVELREASEKGFDDVKREVAVEVARESKARELARAAAQKTHERLQSGEALDAQWPAGEQVGGKPQVATTDAFSPMGGIIPGVGAVPALSSAVFAQAEAGLGGEVVEDQKAFFVYRVTEREHADLAELDEVREQLRERLKGQRQIALRNAWLEELREAAKVKENPQVLAYEVRQATSFDPNAF